MSNVSVIHLTVDCHVWTVCSDGFDNIDTSIQLMCIILLLFVFSGTKVYFSIPLFGIFFNPSLWHILQSLLFGIFCNPSLSIIFNDQWFKKVLLSF